MKVALVALLLLPALPAASSPAWTMREDGLLLWHQTELPKQLLHVRFSNRRFGVKHFQTIHQCGVDVARGLVLLFGIGTGAFPSWDSRTRRNNLLVGLAVEERRSKRTYELTSSIVPQGTSFHRSVELGFSPIGFDPERSSCGCRGLLSGPPELGAVNPDAVHDHGQPARQRHDRLLHPAAPGDLHGPRLEPGPFF